MAVCTHNLDETICHYHRRCRHGRAQAACRECGGRRIDHRPKPYERPDTAWYDERPDSVRRNADRSGVRKPTPGAGASPSAVALSSQELGVLELLKEWRLKRSRDDEVPAFVVAHDRTLVEIARARPATREALLRVRGVGPSKVKRYGIEILDVLRRARVG